MIDSALTPYRRIFAHPGAAAFSLTGLVARLPISMMALGIVLLAEHETGSYALAGALSATSVMANAVCAIGQGVLVDRYGQGRVLRAVITGWGVALAATMAALEADAPRWAAFVCAALAGGTLPSVGTCVRARWSSALTDPRELQTAYAFEAVADELVFVSGPILVTMLATYLHPLAGLGSALVAGTLGTYAFAAQRATEPVAHPSRSATGPRPPMPWRVLGPLTLVGAALGVMFGAAEVSTVGFADEHGRQDLAGLLLATWALGSLTAGLVTGSVHWRRGPLTRLRWGAVGLFFAVLPLPWIPSIPVMVGVFLLGGLAIAPTLIATMSLAESVLPPSRLTEGMAYIQTGLMAGVAPGAAAAGVAIERYGASSAYLVSVAATVLTLVASAVVVLPATVRSHEREEGTDQHVA